MGATSTMLAFCVLSMTQTWIAFADDRDDLLEQIQLSRSYAGDAVVDYVRPDGKLETWKRVEFELRLSSLWIKTFDLYGVEGEGIQAIRYGDSDESWLLYMGQYQADRSLRFAKTLTDAGEIDISPMPVVRALELLAQAPRCELLKVGDDSTRSYVIDLGIESAPGIIEIDIQDGKILKIRKMSSSGNTIKTVQYDDWVPVGNSGAVVPTETISTLWGSGSENTVIQRFHISNVREIDPDLRHAKPSVPPGFTITDFIDGVTIHNGEVIDKISQGPHRTGSAKSATGKKSIGEKYFLWIGVAVIVLSAAIFAHQRKGCV